MRCIGSSIAALLGCLHFLWLVKADWREPAAVHRDLRGADVMALAEAPAHRPL